MNWPVTYRRKIRFSDTDAQGIVFNGNYATYIDDTVTDFLDAIGLPWDVVTASGHDMVLARSEIDFRSAGRLGETWEEKSRRVIIDARQIQVVVDNETLRPKSVPDFLVAAVERAQGGTVERSVAQLKA